MYSFIYLIVNRIVTSINIVNLNKDVKPTVILNQPEIIVICNVDFGSLMHINK